MTMHKWLAVLTVGLIGVTASAITEAAPAGSKATSRWSGVYVGGQVGSAGTHYDGVYDSDDSFSSRVQADGMDDTGYIGTILAGWSRQRGTLVYGFEGDLGTGDIAGDALEPEDLSEKATANVGWLASLRGRIGWGKPNLLVFGTAGIAYITGDYDIRDRSDGPGGTDFDQAGFVAGGGAEWGLWKRVSLRGDLRYFAFGDKIGTSHLTPDSGSNDFIKLKDVLALGVGVTVHL